MKMAPVSLLATKLLVPTCVVCFGLLILVSELPTLRKNAQQPRSKVATLAVMPPEMDFADNNLPTIEKSTKAMIDFDNIEKDRQKPLYPNEPHLKILIAVASDWKHYNSDLGKAARDTWVPAVTLRPSTDVLFFVGECYDMSTVDSPEKLVCLNDTDSYPPQRKIFLMWQYLHDHKPGYDVYLKIDQDTYVNPYHYRGLIDAMLPYKNKIGYSGMAMSGRESERALLGLNGQQYCGGLSYMMSRPLVDRLGPYLSGCLSQVVSNHSDTEIGRCVHKFGGTECRQLSSAGFIRQIYVFRTEDNTVTSRSFSNKGTMHITFPKSPSNLEFDAALVHPIKVGSEMKLFHKQVTQNLRPLHRPIKSRILNTEDRQREMFFMDQYRTTCVHNSDRQTRFQMKVRECTSPAAEWKPTIPKKVHILDILQRNNSRLLDQLSKLSIEPISHSLRELDRSVRLKLFKHVPRDQSLSFTQVAELFILQKIINEIVEAIPTFNEPRSPIMILRGTTELVPNFSSKLLNVLKERRCGGHLFTHRKGGALILAPGAPYCLRTYKPEICSNVKGADCATAVGWILHPHTLPDIQKWLTKTINSVGTTGAVPFVKVFEELADLGYIVRMASSPLLNNLPEKGSLARSKTKS